MESCSPQSRRSLLTTQSVFVLSIEVCASAGGGGDDGGDDDDYFNEGEDGDDSGGDGFFKLYIGVRAGSAWLVAPAHDVCDRKVVVHLQQCIPAAVC